MSLPPYFIVKRWAIAFQRSPRPPGRPLVFLRTPRPSCKAAPSFQEMEGTRRGETQSQIIQLLGWSLSFSLSSLNGRPAGSSIILSIILRDFPSIKAHLRLSKGVFLTLRKRDLWYPRQRQTLLGLHLDLYSPLFPISERVRYMI